MNSQATQPGATAIPVHDMLRTLATLAAGVVNEHTESHGRCAACGSDWPCRRVTTAEHNLAIL
jgi:hypothetical protein